MITEQQVQTALPTRYLPQPRDHAPTGPRGGHLCFALQGLPTEQVQVLLGDAQFGQGPAHRGVTKSRDPPLGTCWAQRGLYEEPRDPAGEGVLPHPAKYRRSDGGGSRRGHYQSC